MIKKHRNRWRSILSCQKANNLNPHVMTLPQISPLIVWFHQEDIMSVHVNLRVLRLSLHLPVPSGRSSRIGLIRTPKLSTYALASVVCLLWFDTSRNHVYTWVFICVVSSCVTYIITDSVCKCISDKYNIIPVTISVLYSQFLSRIYIFISCKSKKQK